MIKIIILTQLSKLIAAAIGLIVWSAKVSPSSFWHPQTNTLPLVYPF
jgi:hypothetical protein